MCWQPFYEQTYAFQVTQYGPSWYHSHFALQCNSSFDWLCDSAAGSNLTFNRSRRTRWSDPTQQYEYLGRTNEYTGPLMINGPTSMNYDVAMTPWLISDWYHENPFPLFYVKLTPDGPPQPASTLLQGQGIFCSDTQANTNCTGSYWETTFVKDTTYKLSIVNAGTQTQFTFWIDGHSFWVVDTDFVPIEPFWADTLNIAVGKSSNGVHNLPIDLLETPEEY